MKIAKPTTDTEPSEVNSKTTSNKKPSNESKIGFQRIFIAMFIGSLCLIVGILFIDIKQLKQNLEPNALIKQDNLLLDQLAVQQKKMLTQFHLMNKQQENLEETLQLIQTDLDHLKSDQSKSFSLLSEISEYELLVDKVYFKLTIEEDVKGALAILKFLKKKTTSPKFAELHQKIENILIALKPYENLNLSELLIQLDQLENTLMQEPLQIRSLSDKAAQVTKKSSPMTWQDKLLANLKEVILIQRMDEPVKPILNAHEKALLQYEFKLKLQQAQMALLSNHFERFQTLLTELKHKVGKYIDLEKIPKLNDQFDKLFAYHFPKDLPNLTELQQSIQKMRAAPIKEKN